MFQSTPDLINRENASQGTQMLAFSQFQSTPDLINRENVRFILHVTADLDVSIHSRFN